MFVRAQSWFSFGDWVREILFHFNDGTGVEVITKSCGGEDTEIIF